METGTEGWWRMARDKSRKGEDRRIEWQRRERKGGGKRGIRGGGWSR